LYQNPRTGLFQPFSATPWRSQCRLRWSVESDRLDEPRRCEVRTALAISSTSSSARSTLAMSSGCGRGGGLSARERSCPLPRRGRPMLV